MNVGGPRRWDICIDISFHSKMEGNAKQRHCLSRQHINLNIVPSFLRSRRLATRVALCARAAGSWLWSQATWVEAWMTGYMSKAKAPK